MQIHKIDATTIGIGSPLIHSFWYILITFFCKRKKIKFSFLPEGTGLACVSRTNFDLLAGIWKISARVDLSRWDLSSLVLESFDYVIKEMVNVAAVQP